MASMAAVAEWPSLVKDIFLV